MLTVSAKSRSTTTPLEAGSYPARCVQVIDIGDQYNSLSDKMQRQVVLCFEIPGERIEIDGESKPRMMSVTYTQSLGDKAKLRSVLESWRGKQFTPEELKAFDLRNIVNVPCMLTIVEKTSKEGRKYAVIGGISKMPKGFSVPDAETQMFAFDLDEKGALDALDTLPEWICDRIKQSDTYAKMTASVEDAFSDLQNPSDLPFGNDDA